MARDRFIPGGKLNYGGFGNRGISDYKFAQLVGRLPPDYEIVLDRLCFRWKARMIVHRPKGNVARMDF